MSSPQNASSLGGDQDLKIAHVAEDVETGNDGIHHDLTNNDSDEDGSSSDSGGSDSDEVLYSIAEPVSDIESDYEIEKREKSTSTISTSGFSEIVDESGEFSVRPREVRTGNSAKTCWKFNRKNTTCILLVSCISISMLPLIITAIGYAMERNK